MKKTVRPFESPDSGGEFHFRPHMHDGESLAGYLMRFSSDNVLAGMKGLARYLRIDAWEIFEIERLTLMQMLWGRDGGRRADSEHFLGAKPPTRYGARALRRVCPVCLGSASENQCSLAAWDRPMATHCSKHRVMLLDTCSDCGQPLDYMSDRHPAACSCGADLRAQAKIPVPTWLADIHWILDPSSCTKVMDPLDPEQTAAQVLQQIASMHDVADPRLAVGELELSAPFATAAACMRSKEWFSNWPRGIGASLVRRGWRPGRSVSLELLNTVGARNFDQVAEAVATAEALSTNKLFPAPGFTPSRPKRARLDLKAEEQATLFYPEIFLPTPFPMTLLPAARPTASPDEVDVEVAADVQTEANEDMAGLSGFLPHALVLWMTRRAREAPGRPLSTGQNDLGAFLNLLGIATQSGGPFGATTRVTATLRSLLSIPMAEFEGQIKVASCRADLGVNLIGSLDGGVLNASEPGSVRITPWFEVHSRDRAFDLNRGSLSSLGAHRVAKFLYIYARSMIATGREEYIPIEDVASQIGMRGGAVRTTRRTIMGALKMIQTCCPDVEVLVDGHDLRFRDASRQ